MPYLSALEMSHYKALHKSMYTLLLYCSTAVQKLEELEKEEELREKAGMYESDMSDDDEEMKEKRELARQ